MTVVYVAGTGSFALEVAEYARDAGFVVAGLVELLDPERVGREIHGLEVVGIDEPRSSVILGLAGDRREHSRTLAEHGWPAATLIHPAAHVSTSATIAAGCIVGPQAVVGAATEVEPHALLGRGALVGHHAVIGAGATLNPGANVAGNTTIGSGATVGMGAVVGNGVEVGEDSIVAAGAVVLKPVEARTRVQGVPARVFTRR
jgi:sugar O-acyltransferase (sialic acid O-acetyltransferase NeuD family)